MKRVKRSFDPDIMKCQKGGKPMREYIVETKNLKKYYQMGANTVKALEKMGVLSDTWHLYNYDELDEIQKKTGVTE